MAFATAVLLAVGVLVFTLFVRDKDVPEPDTPSPTAHLEEKKSRIYENLRDLQFEYRLGKLSDEDYQKTKQALQAELAGVLAEIDSMQPAPVASKVKKQEPAKPEPPRLSDVCPHCGARFAQAQKYCGFCGKAMV